LYLLVEFSTVPIDLPKPILNMKSLSVILSILTLTSALPSPQKGPAPLAINVELCTGENYTGDCDVLVIGQGVCVTLPAPFYKNTGSLIPYGDFYCRLTWYVNASSPAKSHKVYSAAPGRKRREKTIELKLAYRCYSPDLFQEQAHANVGTNNRQADTCSPHNNAFVWSDSNAPEGEVPGAPALHHYKFDGAFPTGPVDVGTDVTSLWCDYLVRNE
jgi:hypothetical protein